MAEYTEQLSAIAQQLSTIGDKLDGVNGIVTTINTTLQTFKGDSGLVVDNSALVSKLDDLITAINSSQVVPVDYSAKLEKLSQVLVYTDLLLLVLVTFLVVGVGFVVGSKLTDRLKLNG